MDIFWNLILLFLIIVNRAFEQINNQVEPQIPSHEFRAFHNNDKSMYVNMGLNLWFNLFII